MSNQPISRTLCEEVASDKVRIGHSKGRLYNLVASEFDDILVLLLVSSDNHFEGNELMYCMYIHSGILESD